MTPVSISDHHLVYITLNFLYDADSFVQDISDVPWAVIDDLNDFEDRLNAFHMLFNSMLDKHAAIKRVKLRTRPSPS